MARDRDETQHTKFDTRHADIMTDAHDGTRPDWFGADEATDPLPSLETGDYESEYHWFDDLEPVRTAVGAAHPAETDGEAGADAIEDAVATAGDRANGTADGTASADQPSGAAAAGAPGEVADVDAADTAFDRTDDVTTDAGPIAADAETSADAPATAPAPRASDGTTTGDGSQDRPGTDTDAGTDRPTHSDAAAAGSSDPDDGRSGPVAGDSAGTARTGPGTASAAGPRDDAGADPTAGVNDRTVDPDTDDGRSDDDSGGLLAWIKSLFGL
jgi:hypothetical protein